MHKTNMPFQRTLRALGYVDVLCVPTSIVEQEVLPRLPPSELPQLPAENANNIVTINFR